jgi:hypothetical protein
MTDSGRPLKKSRSRRGNVVATISGNPPDNEAVLYISNHPRPHFSPSTFKNEDLLAKAGKLILDSHIEVSCAPYLILY